MESGQELPYNLDNGINQDFPTQNNKKMLFLASPRVYF